MFRFFLIKVTTNTNNPQILHIEKVWMKVEYD